VIGVDGAVLGRVVIYRNGVAFYERRATVVDGQLAVHVPRERVDDFLKSLTVVDPATRRPLAISIPRRENDGSTLTMTIETADRARADVLLTYVTEAPAWKPSYRVVVGAGGKVMLEGWAIVDNMSGEDWKGVQVGVGASSALSFRYDLWSVRHVDRDLLRGEDRFAVAPPTGVVPFEEAAPEEMATLEDATGIEGVVSDKASGDKLAGVTVVATSPALTGTATTVTDEQGFYKLPGLPPGTYLVTFYYADVQTQAKAVAVSKDRLTPLHESVDQRTGGGELVRVEARAPTIDPTSTSEGITIDRDYIKNIPVHGRSYSGMSGTGAGFTNESPSVTRPPPPPDLHALASRVLEAHKDVVLEVHGTDAEEVQRRGQSLQNRLVDQGVPATRLHMVPKVGHGEATSVRVLAVPPARAQHDAPAPPTAHTATPDTPVGESHFLSERPMTVRAGSSAMVSMVHSETGGGVVYLYDPISERGDQRFAFKAVRVDNPTGDTLEPGPVTVYGDGRFIGEGITEPVPPHAAVVVPFALDRQIVVTSSNSEADQIAKLVTVQRGIVTAEVQHRRIRRFTVTSRLDQPARVYLRHRLQSDGELVAAPPRSLKLGDSRLFEIDLPAHGTQEVEIVEATPVERKLELSSPEALGMMQVFVEDPAAPPALRGQLEALLATHHSAADLEDKIRTLHDQLAEYRGREGELHAQLVTLRAVKTGGELMTALKSKLADINDRIQRATIAVVDAQEQLMLLRLRLQNQLAELHLS
jgi:hypothetical protein